MVNEKRKFTNANQGNYLSKVVGNIMAQNGLGRGNKKMGNYGKDAHRPIFYPNKAGTPEEPSLEDSLPWRLFRGAHKPSKERIPELMEGEPDFGFPIPAPQNQFLYRVAKAAYSVYLTPSCKLGHPETFQQVPHQVPAEHVQVAVQVAAQQQQEQQQQDEQQQEQQQEEQEEQLPVQLNMEAISDQGEQFSGLGLSLLRQQVCAQVRTLP